MPMNVKPVPTLDERINDIRMRTAAIINEEILPNERKLWRGRASGADEAERKESAALREHEHDEHADQQVGPQPVAACRRQRMIGREQPAPAAQQRSGAGA